MNRDYDDPAPVGTGQARGSEGVAGDGGVADAFSRVVVGRWPVVVLAAALPVVALLVIGQPVPRYQSTARIEAAATSATVSRIEVDALVDRVTALATTPAILAAAEHDLRPADGAITPQDVSTSRLGLSPLVDIVVTGAEPGQARARATAVARGVVAFINTQRVAAAAAQADPASMRTLSADLDRRIAAADAQINQLQGQLATATPGSPSALAVLASLSSAESLRTELIVEQARIEADQLARGVPAAGIATVVDQAVGDPAPVPSRRLAQLGMALLAGLAVGLLVAAAVEALRPRVTTARALARTLRAPLLGRLSGDPGGQPDVIGDIRGRLAMAARRAGATTVLLAPLSPRDRVTADTLREALGQSASPADATEAADPPMAGGLRIEVLGEADPGPRDAVALVAVARVPVARRHLESLDDVLGATDWPLAGAIACQRRGRVRIGTADAQARHAVTP